MEKHKHLIQRPVYGGVNMGQNDPRDTFNSIIPSTVPSPVRFMGFDTNHNPLYVIPPDIVKKLNLKTKAQYQALIEEYLKYKNYCPFLNEIGKCAVYKQRPQICREFGSYTDKINICPKKSSRTDIFKFICKELSEVNKEFIKKIFSKKQ